VRTLGNPADGGEKYGILGFPARYVTWRYGHLKMPETLKSILEPPGKAYTKTKEKETGWGIIQD